LASDSFGENLAGGLLSGGLDRETSKLLGDDRVASWEQVGEDAFGNALANAVIGKINTPAQLSPDFSKVDPQKQQELFAEADAEGQGSTSQGLPALAQTTSDSAELELNENNVKQLPDVVLSSAEQGRLASTTAWPYNYVDPYAIARNDGIASGVEYTQTFSLPDEAPATVTQLASGATASSGSNPSLLSQVDGQIHQFNNIVRDGLVDDGAQALRDGNQAAFVFGGLKYAFYQTFMPDSVEQAAIGIAGGKVLGTGVGYLAKEAVAVAPVLGKSLGDLASDAGKSVGGIVDNLRSTPPVTDTPTVPKTEAPIAPEAEAPASTVPEVQNTTTSEVPLTTAPEAPTVAIGQGLGSLTDNQLAALRGAGLSDEEIAGQIRTLGDVQLFRGTSEGFPGNPVLQQLGITPASTDPLAATVFSLESKAIGGDARVFSGAMNDFAGGDIDLGNVRSSLEREVQVNMSPSAFQAKAPNAIPVDVARQALSDMGIADLPPIITSTQQATQILEETPRLTPAQIKEFLQRTVKPH
jgi:hypothetical protein